MSAPTVPKYIEVTLSVGQDHETDMLTGNDSSTKAKKYGFFGSVDSYESILSVAREFVELKIVPDPGKIASRP